MATAREVMTGGAGFLGERQTLAHAARRMREPVSALSS